MKSYSKSVTDPVGFNVYCPVIVVDKGSGSSGPLTKAVAFYYLFTFSGMELTY